MGYNPQGIMNIYEIIRRWHQGHTISGIAATLNLDRKTVRRYIRSAQQAGIDRETPLAEEAALLSILQPLVPSRDRPKPAAEQFAPYREEIMGLLEDPADPLTLKSAWQVICHRHPEITASYSSLKRLARGWRPARTNTWRHETPPGQQAQIDYGKVGLLHDAETGRRRAVYAFVATLSWSRYKYVEFVWSQDQQGFVGSHLKMFGFWGGTPQVLVPDNLKSGVLKPDRYDPQLNPLYRQMADHYGCFIDPARPGHPKDKGKVERAIRPVRELFRRLKALDPGLTLAEANKKALHWCRHENGMTRHGTTGEKPWECFQSQEQPALLSAPEAEFELAQWKKVRVHVDQYVQFEKIYYSLPARYVGHTLWLRATPERIELYEEDFGLVKCYQRGPGWRFSDPQDFPDNVQAMMSHHSVKNLLGKATRIGPYTRRYLEAVLQPHAMRNLRKAMGVIELAGKHPAELLETAARQALADKVFTYKGFRRLLEAPQAELPIPISPQTQQWVRDSDYFTHNSNN
jgi:transposase